MMMRRLSRLLWLLVLVSASLGVVRAQEIAESFTLSSTGQAPAAIPYASRLAEQRARKLAAESELSVLPEVQKALEETLARDVRALYRLKRGGLLPLAGGLATLMSHASRVTHLERMTRRTLGELGKARGGREKLAKEVRLLESEIAISEQRVAELSQQAEASAQVQPLSTEDDAPVGTPNVDTPDGRPSYGLSIVDDGSKAERRAFAAQRGALALPVSAPTTIQDAPLGAGILLVTRPGASVRAAADGRVVFAERGEDDALRVVVDHGQRFRTSYAGLLRVDVQVGDAVSKSARLGTAGSAPIAFEVRRGARPQDARAWLGL